MISFKAIARLKIYISRIKLYFLRGNFKKFGKKSIILFPLRIAGAKHIEIGKNVFIYDNSRILAYSSGNEIVMKIEDGVHLGRFAHIVAVKKIIIEKNVLLADKVYISDNTHEYADIFQPIKKQPIKFIGEVIIGENSWVGENVCIIGAKIGKHCVIGANSIVSNDIEDFSVAVGSPAKVIKKYDFELAEWIKIE
jgi:acetyltransferase-like isoleucine patch superfamily enzyme